jgi:hypothetical protein
MPSQRSVRCLDTRDVVCVGVRGAHVRVVWQSGFRLGNLSSHTEVFKLHTDMELAEQETCCF